MRFLIFLHFYPPLDFRVSVLPYRGPIRIYSYDKFAISKIYQLINLRSRKFIIRIYHNRSLFFALLVGSLKNLTPA